MALNVDKNRQLAGYTDTSTAQTRAGQTAASSQASIFSSNSTSNNGVYTVKKGDNLWKFAKEQLIASGNDRPSNADIYNAMLKIAKANGCNTTEECHNKYFSNIGTALIIPVLVDTTETVTPDKEEKSSEPETPILSEQETKIKDELKSDRKSVV